jgi:tRNA(Ile)-lysidine synthase
MAKLAETEYDLVLVNIVADVIIGLSPVLPEFLTDRSTLICSGILDTRLEDVLSALKSVGLTYRTDSTNSDTDYLRNYIRHEIIPVFEKRKDINLFKSISRATENLQRENAFLEDFAIKNYTDSAKELLKLEDAILYRVLTRKLEKEYGIILDSNHFEAIKKLLEKGSSKELIKENVFAVCEKGKFQFRKVDIKDEVIYPLTEGDNFVADKKILIKRIKEFYKGLTKFTVDCDKINGNLFARTKRDGDVFYCINRNVTTKLAKLLKNDGVPNFERDRLLVICDESEHVVFLEGYGADKRFVADKNSQNIINIEII